MDPLDLARVFVKTVVRMFYETEHIVVVDALVFHGALSLADLAVVLDYGKQLKTAQKLCGKLKEGGLVSVFARPELRDGAMKAVTREYYYVDYRRAIDATKYRIHMLDEKIKDNSKPTQEKKEFFCSQCKSQWTTMDVLDKMDPFERRSGFLCKECDHPLDYIHNSKDAEPENDDTPAKFNRQFASLLKLMQEIDQVTIPAVEGEDAVERAIELPRDNDINPAAKHEPVAITTARPTAVKGIQTGPEKIEISIATDKEYTEAERAAETQRTAQLAKQNQLPEWHVKSTVDDKEYFSKAKNSAVTTNGINPLSYKVEPEEDRKKTADPARDPTLDAYFAALKAEQEREAKEAEEEDEEEDDDEFEDVVEGLNGVPDAKRVKVETPPVPVLSPQVKVEQSPSHLVPSPKDGGEESDEDDDFESVI
ncbi:hypothetical protein K432DRAFT_346858 [Lepidopterella palustris CBS 459.81]|uniref:HTH TFE/IIEalpha-type domain-containing protein n=1 Tax=Lepidopterella palustris CBS 459.81 TaxID=1314670 RepID=A0A8E2EHB3_9PEZI|nr:hypothetical protein K432DRAFT_346858 [Lepidopterella palustris CBS 459.81]